MDTSSLSTPTMMKMTNKDQWDGIKYNNLGVNMVHQSNYKGAAKYFKRSLTATKRALKQSRPATTTCLPVDQQQDIVNNWIVNSLNFNGNNNTNDGSHPYIFGNPIPIQEYNDALPPAIYAAITLFNLGLSYNLLAWNSPADMATTTNRNDLIKTAISMYELSNECLRADSIDIGPYFMMTVANNLGVCCNIIGDHDGAKRFFEYLLSVQMFLMDSNQINCITTSTSASSQNAGSSSSSPCSVTDGFWCNTSSLVLSDCTAAAA